MDEQKPEALEAERMLTEFGCTDISVTEQNEDAWLLSASVPGIAMIAFSDRCAHTPRDPVYLAGQIIADITRIRSRARKAAPTREEIVAKLAALMKEKRHEATSNQAPMGDHGGDSAGGADPDAPVLGLDPAGADNSGGDSSGDGLRPLEGATETLEAVEADIVPAPEAQPLDADSAPVDEPERAVYGGMMVDDARQRLAARVDEEARPRLDACDDVIRNAPMTEINNARMRGGVTDHQAAQEAAYYAAVTRRLSVAEVARKTKEEIWRAPPDKLATINPADPEIWKV